MENACFSLDGKSRFHTDHEEIRCVWTVTFLTTTAADDTMIHEVLKKKATFLIRPVRFSALLSLKIVHCFLQHPAAALSIISYSEPSGNCATMTLYMNHLVSFGLVLHCN